MIDNTYIIIPAYNEEKTIGSVIDSIKKKCYKKIVVIDDGSLDHTYQISVSKGTLVLRHIFNLGQGAAIETGFEYCRQRNANIVVTFDADGQFDPKDIKKMTKPIINNEVDITLGSRFLGKTYKMPFVKKIVLKLGILFTFFYSEIILTDAHNGFRALNNKALCNIQISQNKMAHASEVIDQIKSKKLRYREIPVTVYYNKKKSQGLIGGFRIIFDLLVRLIT